MDAHVEEKGWFDRGGPSKPVRREQRSVGLFCLAAA